MNLLDAYRQKLEAQIHEHKAKLDLLKARARRVAAQTRIVGYEELAQADKHLEHVKARFKDLKGAGGTALGEIRTAVQKALGDLKDSTTKAAKHFSDHVSHATPPPPKPRPRAKHTKVATAAKHAAKVVKHSKVARTVKHTAKVVRDSKVARAVKHAAKVARHNVAKGAKSVKTAKTKTH